MMGGAGRDGSPGWVGGAGRVAAGSAMLESVVGLQGDAPSFVVFSDDWGVHPSSCQHLIRQIAERHRVLWVNTIGMRNPTFNLSDARKAVVKLSRMIGPGRLSAPIGRTHPNVQVCQPAMLPFSGTGVIRRFNQGSVVAAVEGRARAAGMIRPVIVSTVPNACDYVDFLDRSRLVYYCVDDFTQWPGLQHGLVREMEERLIGQSDVLVAASEELYRRLAVTGKPTHLLSHGVDLAHFGLAAQQSHPCLAEIPRPRAGYFGLFDERSDRTLLVELASRMKDLSFVVAGPVAVASAKLAEQPNVWFTGPVDYEALPMLIAGLDVLMLPYVVSNFTATISPLKLKEYLATGLPVVSTPIAEARLMKEHVTIAASPDEWAAALRAALGVDRQQRHQQMSEMLREETWARKAEQFLAFCGC